ncbi:ATP-dependent nuclease [Methylobacterium bullatum]|uniref:DNA replication and repair protein RecF n=1 Tax=Methylobacterium bullatum TaxID=570505 RepID=A0A679K0I1_9HYPH|nr:DNA replication and repair protein RecF [Methylobacterium bullatum]
MHLHSYRLKNFRRLRDVHVELADNISIFVGANNSGKTSSAQALQTFLSGSRERFSIYDFSSHIWAALNEIGSKDPTADADVTIPSLSLDLWFEVTASDLYLVIPILPSSSWAGTLVGIRVEFSATNGLALLQRYRHKRQEGHDRVAALPGGAGNYVPWPKCLTDYLEQELSREFEFRYFVLDRAQFDESFEPTVGYEPVALGGDASGATVLKSLIKIDNLSAQRHLADSFGNDVAGRSEDLSRRLSRFYKHNLDQRGDDHLALKALFESEEGLNTHLMKVFDDTLKRIATLGYPGLTNPRLEIKSGLNPATVMSQDARINYVLGEGANAVRLPDSYNGLGFKNLIYMVVEVLDIQQRWKSDEDKRAPLHLILIEEPEAHLHAQLQQVFIRNVLSLLKIDGEADGAFKSQVIVTTHSPHILYERGFDPIRYFRRHLTDGEQTTQVLNLSRFQKGDAPKDRDFLQRYLKLTHCDLFFSDAVILVEGNVERLLLPLMIEKCAIRLRSASLCILEVGGAFGHRFKELIEFLGITTLVITDVDSVQEVPEPVEEDEEEAEKEFELPAIDDAGEAETRYGRTCLPSELGARTANQTLIQWLPRKRTIAELHAVEACDKSEPLAGSETVLVRIAYQTPVSVSWEGQNAMLCGRTLEEAFGLDNAMWCQAPDQRTMGLKLRGVVASPAALATGLHKRVTGKHFDKTKFALGVLSRRDSDWIVPAYIREGLEWLRDQVDLEIEHEIEAVKEAAAETPVTAAVAHEVVE